MPKYLNVVKKIIKIDIERLGSLVINLAQYLKKDFNWQNKKLQNLKER